MNKKFKSILILLYLFLINVVYSVEVVPIKNIEEVTNNNPQNETLKGIIIFVFTILILIGLAALILILIVRGIIKIQKKIKDINKSKKDFLYKTFEINSELCHKNRDTDLKKRKLKTLFLTWHRSPIYIDTENGLKQIGFYDGETYKKENFLMIGIYNKLGMFKVNRTIILVPYILRNIIRREIIDGKKIIILKCEGLDAYNNTEYYMIPLIKDKDNKSFLDFSDYIHKQFIEKTVYQDLIKENLLQYREGIIKSVEMNPNLQFKRRTE